MSGVCSTHNGEGICLQNFGWKTLMKVIMWKISDVRLDVRVIRWDEVD